jgi:small conductance mechanosensitive channel
VEDYWDVWFDTHEKIKKEFDAAGIAIPFPQRDVHLFNEK